MSAATAQERIATLLREARVAQEARGVEFLEARATGSTAAADAASTAYSLATGLVRALEEAQEAASRLFDIQVAV